MIRLFFAVLFCFCFVGTSFSQVQINEDFPIDQLMNKYTESNKSKGFINGWRIQIMARTDRQAIERAKEEFMLQFPGVSCDWTHSKPSYRLRVGAFRTKLEAIKKIQEIKQDYPGSFLVQDNISKNEVIPSF